MSNEGFMEITVKNTGLLLAQYTITYDCDDNIIPLSSDEISLDSEEIKTINKSINTNSNKGRENKCVIMLKNSIGEKIDLQIIKFNTTNEITMNKQESEQFNNGDSVIYDNKNGLICEEYCNDILNFFCYYRNSCWELLFKKILILGIGIIIFALVFKLCKKIFCCFKCIKYIFCCNFCCFKITKNKNKRKEINSSNDEIEMVSCDKINKK